MSARRSLLTALGATTLLAALWFVPSANATAPDQTPSRSGLSYQRSLSDQPGRPGQADQRGEADQPGQENRAAQENRATLTPAAAVVNASAAREAASQPLSLADTGSVDTSPYLLGGALCLGVGAGFVAFSVRRSRAQ
ncbi:hypothetical protein GCM10010347_14260 [Streptomyces cirratus]|uniref:Gram-positive cocci surface proteins LPxTG domain-containing protein n=1 Tax=Streptomyces cirratus TaxID=68187 RepID=A0ABQ3ER36_9ACTN|nr:hypothetical protein [Streptomyces cirratus]GHB45832.1 hypothetical protein GCM10010347_14260 [Streptomyces cirratus]